MAFRKFVHIFSVLTFISLMRYPGWRNLELNLTQSLNSKGWRKKKSGNFARKLSQIGGSRARSQLWKIKWKNIASFLLLLLFDIHKQKLFNLCVQPNLGVSKNSLSIWFCVETLNVETSKQKDPLRFCFIRGLTIEAEPLSTIVWS